MSAIQLQHYQLSRFSKTAGLAVSLIGLLGLLGWIFDISVLTRIVPGWATMKATTAVSLIAAGPAIWFAVDGSVNGKLFARVLSGLVLILSGLSLLEYVIPIDFGIDRLFSHDSPDAVHPGRMSPATAIGLLFSATAIISAGSSRFFSSHSHWLTAPPLIISSVAVIGYIFGVSSLYKVAAYNSMAANTAAAMLIMSFAIVSMNTNSGIARILMSDTAGGFMARRMLPLIPVALVALGWLRLQGQDAGYYDTRFGLAVMVVSAIVFSVALVTVIAFQLEALDKKRKAAEEELVAVNTQLEERVTERTMELQNSLNEVKQLTGMLPICAWCKNIRGDKDYWQSVEEYISHHTDAVFSHGICPDCTVKVLAGEA